MATDKKERILAALKRVRPLPTGFIEQVEAEDDEAWFDQWLGRTKDDWLRRRPNDGDDIYNALHPTNQAPVREKEFGLTTLEEIRGSKAFLIGADELGDSRISFAGKTISKVTGDSNSGATAVATLGNNTDTLLSTLVEINKKLLENSIVAREQATLALDLQLGARFGLLSERPTVNPTLKVDAAIFYGLVPAHAKSFGNTKLRCMLLQTDFPPSHVIHSHVFQRNWQNDKSIVHLDDIDNPRNTIFLYKPIERHFSHGNLVFLWESTSKSFVCKVLNQALRSSSLDDCANNLLAKTYCDKKVPVSVMTGKTLGDLDGLKLNFGNQQRPFKRCFAFHALVARREAVKQGYIKSVDEVEIDDSMWSSVPMDESVVSSWLTTGYTYPSE